ncbi:MAG TPA: glycoside hydrolase family 3 N-terminal domain-containing protein, partial [Spirochaetia bacterium]|nr:glycoside hydrolase family 3 N-terminal domain-containing protein [Spirochaetia bacterium]
HGDTTNDSHLGSAVVNQTLARLESVELLPFKAGIAAGADGVLIGHLLLPEVLKDPRIPATFSPYVLEELLRRQLNFKKIIITDALNMGAIVDTWGPKTAAVDALVAGADILLMPAVPSEACIAVVDAVKSGEITEARLDESVYRILMVKLERQVIGEPPKQPDPRQVFGSAEGRRILLEIESESARNRKRLK